MISIRAARPDDNPAVRSLVRRSLLDYGIEAEFDGLDAAIGMFGSSTSDNMIELVAQLEPALAGCVALRWVDDGVAKLFGFHVESAVRGRGVGRMLLSAALDEARAHGVRHLMLDTWGSMAAAVRLYESMGWTRAADPPPESGADRSYVLAL
jgi:ribosomal protein S18 acetylase RimI-like enzyme